MDALLTKIKPVVEPEKHRDEPKQKITGSEILLESLVEEGADIIFGYPGGAIMPDGRVGLVLDVNGLVRIAHGDSGVSAWAHRRGRARLPELAEA